MQTKQILLNALKTFDKLFFVHVSVWSVLMELVPEFEHVLQSHKIEYTSKHLTIITQKARSQSLIEHPSMVTDSFVTL